MNTATLSAQGALFCAGPLLARNHLQDAMGRATRTPEPQALAPLLPLAQLPAARAAQADALTRQLVQAMRDAPQRSGKAGLVQSLMQEYALSSEEGVALMCLAEALLRIPDAATRDALIRDKIAPGNWQQHLGQSDSLFVNASSWGLLLTGQMLAPAKDGQLMGSLVRLLGKAGAPLIRKSVDMAMRLLGEQFVMGETIAQALQRARSAEAQGFRYSYDMLGEAALTEADAQRYLAAYENAIRAIGAAAQGEGVCERAGISIKLSALHPRYSRAQQARVTQALLPRVLHLAELARQFDIGLNIDAEESERLDLSLHLLSALCEAPSLQGWHGIGFVVQAYQKRCPLVIDFLIDLSRRTQHRLMVRLVKGAYWDSEIKRAQLDGQSDYPVYTRKHHTDVSYLACAHKLLAASDAVYPQFATHNAHTLATVLHMAQAQLGEYAPQQYEFQCLHGMGEPLYQQVVGAQKLGLPCRIYAPVGTHETLLAYLVRRLLENGANSSFVNRMADATVPLSDLVKDPVAQVHEDAQHHLPALGDTDKAVAHLGQPHPHIPLPRHLYGAARQNSVGFDLADEATLRQLCTQMQPHSAPWQVRPLLAVPVPDGPTHAMHNPADHSDLLGHVQDASPADVQAALDAAALHAPAWAATPPSQRAALLEQAAHLLEANAAHALALLVREAGKTWGHAVGELREAVDFLRYYAAQVRRDFDTATHRPLGVVVCISPWNFPLAIFVGQVAAALAAGNPVLAKPAEATPAIAALAVALLWQAGVPPTAVQLLPGTGREVGMALVCDPRVQGVMFTGSTETARVLQTALAQRVNAQGQTPTLIAETGGQNCMVVDSSALLEQVCSDAVASAFEAAGQRCSALRVLCVQEEVADDLIAMLQGAMQELRLGVPAQLATDVGPVIDARAQQTLEAHIQAMAQAGQRVYRADALSPLPKIARPHGTYVAPTLIEIAHLGQLTREVFGPVLHVLRYKREALGALLAQINASGYALTLGVHSRLDATIAQVCETAHAGNVYVNRNMVGAVVGVQPFGGEGLSGTGPKAGGPLYLLRLLSQQPKDAALQAVHASGRAQHGAAQSALFTVPSAQPSASAPLILPPLLALQDWALQHEQLQLAQQCTDFAQYSPAGLALVLAGPTGEHNTYRLAARPRILCLAGPHAARVNDLLCQLAAVLAVGSRAVWPETERELWATLPAAVQAAVELVAANAPAEVALALLHGDEAACLAVAAQLAQRVGPIVTLLRLPPHAQDIPLWRLVSEQSISTNTAAAGGNASLMTLAL